MPLKFTGMDTEERILAQTLELFKMYGIRRVTMDQIATELAVSKRTIYELFHDRDELVRRTFIFAMNQERSDMNSIISQASNVIEALYLIGKDGHQKRSRINPVFFEDIRKYYRHLFDSNKENQKLNAADITIKLLKRGIEENIFLPDLEIKIVNNFIFEMMNMVHNLEITGDSANREMLVIRNIILPYFRGISTEKGRKLLEEYFSSQNENHSNIL